MINLGKNWVKQSMYTIENVEEKHAVKLLEPDRGCMLRLLLTASTALLV